MFMSSLQKYFLWLVLFSAASVASQYGSVVPFSLGNWFGIDVWVPLSAFSVIPLLDCSRSFVQHYSEQANVSFKKSTLHMMLIPFSIATMCSLTAGLPYTIVLGAICAVTVGGYVDIRVFRWIRFVSTKPHIRMRFSNAAATMIGSGIFFSIAFTKWPLSLGLPANELAKPFDALLVGCIAQCIIVWTAGVIIANIMAHIINWLEKIKKHSSQQDKPEQQNSSLESPDQHS